MPKRARRQFTDEYKAEAVNLVRISGKTLPLQKSRGRPGEGHRFKLQQRAALRIWPA